MRVPAILSSTVCLAAVAALVAWPAGTARAQSVMPAGGEFRIAENTVGAQQFPAIAAQRGGTYLVVWESDAQDGSGFGVFGRFYDRTAAPLGPEFRVNEATTGNQGKPAVTVSPAGVFTVAWAGEDGAGGGIFARQFTAAGPLGPEFLVNTYTSGEQSAAAVSAGPAGFAIVWQSAGQDGSGLGVFGRLYDPGAAPLSTEFQLSTATVGDQYAPAVAALESGRYGVAWATPPPLFQGVHTRVFDAAGVPLGPQAPVSLGVVTEVGYVRAMAGPLESFYVGWWAHHTITGAFGVISTDLGTTVQQFSGDNVPVGAPLGVSSAGLGPDARWEGSFAAHFTGRLLAAWASTPSVFPCFVVRLPPCPPPLHEDGNLSGVFARSIGPGATVGQVQVNTFTTGHQRRPAVAMDVHGNALVSWHSEDQDGSGTGVYAQRFGGLFPDALAVDPAGNGVLDAGEAASVRPAWLNRNGATQSFGGSLFGFEGPAGATYTIADGGASYGPMPDGAAQTCTDCYAVSVSVPATRPATHWDTFMGESLTPAAWGLHRVWTLHVGGSFTDVGAASPFYRFVETLLHRGISSGCTATQYCPGFATSRDQMAVLALLAREGAAFVPPACGSPVFGDVPASSPFCPFVEELFRRGVVTGCGGGNYCPNSPVTRAEMAVIVLRTLDPLLDPPACTTPVFADVAAGSPFCRWIEELFRRGVVTGCGGGNYCPGTAVTRAQVAVFLTATFGLTLY